jgi:hypothetical protein
MKAEKESRLLQIPFSPDAKRERQATSATEVEGMEHPRGSALQSLAAELHQAALQGIFDYPLTWTRITRTVAALLVALGAFHAAMVAIPLIRSQGSLLGAIFNWRMLGALLGATLAFTVAALIANAFQRIQISPQGLGVQGVTGWLRIPWKNVEALRIMEVSGSERYMVMIPFKGKLTPPHPAPMLRLIPLLVGASNGQERGLIITSDIGHFERLLQLIVSYMAQEAGQIVPTIEAYVDEHALMPIGQLLIGSEAAISRLTRPLDTSLDPYRTPISQREFDLPWLNILSRQAIIAAMPAVLFFVDINLRHGEKTLQPVQWFWTVIIFGLGIAELPYIAMLARSVGELTVGRGQFNRTIWAHLELQVPRALLVLAGAGLLGVGAPLGFALLLWAAGIALTTYLITRYMMRLHHISVTQALLATAGTAIFQVVLLALLVGLR